MLYNNPNITYTSPKGREFRVMTLAMIPETEKWIGRSLKWHWKATLKMLDDGSILECITGYNDEQLSLKKKK